MKTQNLRRADPSAKIIRAGNQGLKPMDPVELIANLLEKALNAERPFVKSANAVDPVNAYCESAFSIKLTSDNPTHPVDEFYDSIKLELSNRRPFVKPSRPLDMVNALAGNYFASDSISTISQQKIKGIFDSLKEIYRSADKSTNAVDPINEMFYKPSEIVTKYGKPKHSYEDVTDLIKKSLGPAFNDIKPAFAMDIINNVAADQFGGPLPSAEALSLVESKLMAATYELYYKMTPGSSAYKNKAKELEQLKETRKKLQDNLKEINADSTLNTSSTGDPVNVLAKKMFGIKPVAVVKKGNSTKDISSSTNVVASVETTPPKSIDTTSTIDSLIKILKMKFKIKL